MEDESAYAADAFRSRPRAPPEQRNRAGDEEEQDSDMRPLYTFFACFWQLEHQHGHPEAAERALYEAACDDSHRHEPEDVPGADEESKASCRVIRGRTEACADQA